MTTLFETTIVMSAAAAQMAQECSANHQSEWLGRLYEWLVRFSVLYLSQRDPNTIAQAFCPN